MVNLLPIPHHDFSFDNIFMFLLPRKNLFLLKSSLQIITFFYFYPTTSFVLRTCTPRIFFLKVDVKMDFILSRASPVCEVIILSNHPSHDGIIVWAILHLPLLIMLLKTIVCSVMSLVLLCVMPTNMLRAISSLILPIVFLLILWS